MCWNLRHTENGKIGRCIRGLLQLLLARMETQSRSDVSELARVLGLTTCAVYAAQGMIGPDRQRNARPSRRRNVDDNPRGKQKSEAATTS